MATLRWLVGFTCVMFGLVAVSYADNCPPLPEVPKAYARDIVTNEKETTVRFACQIGYYLEGNSRVKCISTADNQWSWTTPAFRCDPVTCRSPDVPVNGRFRGSTFSFGATIEYTCRAGYQLYSADGLKRLERSPARQCSADGLWTGVVPQCKAVICDEPNSPDNGVVFYDSVTYGSIIKYSCHQGYQLDGEKERWCQEDAKWSGHQPNCTEIHEDELCEIPEDIYLGTHYLLPGPKLQYECPDKRRKVSYCTNGQWKPPVPDCKEEKEEESTDQKVPDQEENVPEQEKLSWAQSAGRKIKQLWNDFKSWF